jgi:hypothetical protein
MYTLFLDLQRDSSTINNDLDTTGFKILYALKIIFTQRFNLYRSILFKPVHYRQQRTFFLSLIKYTLKYYLIKIAFMKKFLPLLVSFIFFFAISKAQYVTIPDPGFRSFLQQQYPSCFNSSGMMDTTCSAIVNETKLELQETSIDSLNGIQYFKSLTYLDCTADFLKVISNLPKSLTYLDCFISTA